MAGIEEYINYELSEAAALPQNSPIPNRYSDYPFYPYETPKRPRTRPEQLDLKFNYPKNPTATEEDADVTRYVEIAASLATVITENLLSHPFVVLRRQCQVQPFSRRWHLQPFTLVPVLIRLHQTQGVTTLWKGLGSCLLIRGMNLAVEDLLSKITPWPKEINSDCTNRMFAEHLLLKCTSLAIITPFYSASLVETVQSDIASEKPGLFDVFKEGVCRLIFWGSPHRGRMLPVWALVGPTVLHGLFKYLLYRSFHLIASYTIHLKNRSVQSRQGALKKELGEANNQSVEVQSAFIALVTSEIICYPLETILHRLHLQGTRTIVDNLDSGSEVIPVLSGYEGFWDCYAETVGSEGILGLYKGFGALILQLAAHWTVLRLVRVIAAKTAVLFRSKNETGGVVPTPQSTFNAAFQPKTH